MGLKVGNGNEEGRKEGRTACAEEAEGGEGFVAYCWVFGLGVVEEEVEVVVAREALDYDSDRADGDSVLSLVRANAQAYAERMSQFGLL